MDTVIRNPIEQTFVGISVSVPNSVTPMTTLLNIPNMIQSMILCNPSSNTNSVFFGDQNVSATTGVELLAGTSVSLQIQEVRQLYEIQDPDLLEAQMIACAKITPVSIPVIVWNPSNFYFFASVAGPTLINVLLFRNVYV